MGWLCTLNQNCSCNIFQETISYCNYMSQVRLTSWVLWPLIGILYQPQKMEKRVCCINGTTNDKEKLKYLDKSCPSVTCIPQIPWNWSLACMVRSWLLPAPVMAQWQQISHHSASLSWYAFGKPQAWITTTNRLSYLQLCHVQKTLRLQKIMKVFVKSQFHENVYCWLVFYVMMFCQMHRYVSASNRTAYFKILSWHLFGHTGKSQQISVKIRYKLRVS